MEKRAGNGVEGFAMDREENEIGVMCIACPVLISSARWNIQFQFPCQPTNCNKSALIFFLQEIQQTAQDIP